MNRFSIRMLASLLLASPLLAAVPVAAPAQDMVAGTTQNGRFSMTPAPNGFLRLDTRSGAVSLCTVKENRVTCQSSADERGALESEIARLTARNTELQKKLADAQ